MNSFLIIEFDFILTVDEGGVCAKFHEVQQTNETKEKEWRSHNTGVVNFAYNNNELPSQVVKLAFMHEIGHSLGSPVSNPFNQDQGYLYDRVWRRKNYYFVIPAFFLSLKTKNIKSAKFSFEFPALKIQKGSGNNFMFCLAIISYLFSKLCSNMKR